MSGPTLSRRRALKVIGSAAATVAAGASAACGSDEFAAFFQQHYRKMTKDEVAATIARLERKYQKRYDKKVAVKTTPAPEGVLFGYALSIDRCQGYRDCVHACVQENNLSRDPAMAYIRVLEVDAGTRDLHHADDGYTHDVPAPGKTYLPMQCMQCDDAPCTKACPVDATWTEPDGITVVDYDWCIGCRACATACPYLARRFNWTAPKVPADALNPDTHYLSNRPREVGVIEKCHFCLHRTREGRQPACQEACPTGARVFGNLLDPKSEIRFILENKTVFRLKEELGTEPKFWYFSG